MSHFTTVVILPKGVYMNNGALEIPKSAKGKGVEELLSKALAPFDENRRVKSYLETCHCVGRQAHADKNKKFGKRFEKIKNSFNESEVIKRKRARLNELMMISRKITEEEKREYAKLESDIGVAWRKRIARIEKDEKAFLESHPDRNSADPECSDCGGTGKSKTTYNPKSKWDWWVVGGRWMGGFSDYEPCEDPLNYSKCSVCNGTGTRNDMSPEERAKCKYDDAFGHPAIGEGCNVCGGTGFSRNFMNRDTGSAGNMASCADILERKKGPYIPYAVLTPDGVWHESGKMGWFGISSDNKSEDAWKDEVVSIYQKYGDHVAVLCDLHI